MDRAYHDARAHGWSREPVIEMLIPSTLDDSLAPKGAHVASLFCQHVAPELPDGRSWDDHREEVADLMIATVERYAPGFKDSVIARQALSPLDLERVFGLIGGDIFHGALSLDQLFSARPMLGYADYRSPLPGLYHVRRRRPSRRRRHRRAGAQCRKGDSRGSALAAVASGLAEHRAAVGRIARQDRDRLLPLALEPLLVGVEGLLLLPQRILGALGHEAVHLLQVPFRRPRRAQRGLGDRLSNAREARGNGRDRDEAHQLSPSGSGGDSGVVMTKWVSLRRRRCTIVSASRRGVSAFRSKVKSRPPAFTGAPSRVNASAMNG